MICGHLDADLAALADELLLAEPSRGEPAARRAGAGRAPSSREPAAGAVRRQSPSMFGDAGARPEEILDVSV